MKKLEFSLIALLLTVLYAIPAAAQVGNVYIHDPSTIAFCDGKYYTFGTGSGGLMSDDGWTWRDGAVATATSCPTAPAIPAPRARPAAS